ncbi:Alpha/Beta hydrolase protein [Camillea tinctor]|nr:Alpha/Beta hydrolase protein [Camillea tinctor]
MSRSRSPPTFPYLLLILILAFPSLSNTTITPSPILLPPLTGPYPIGLTHIEFVDPSRATNGSSPSLSSSSSPFRTLMLSVFYPTTPNPDPFSNPHSPSPPLAPQFPPLTSPRIDALLSLPAGTSARLLTRAYPHAPFPPPQTPTLLFSPGFGLARGLYTTLLSALAARGWTVVALDHPGDALAVEYPDGTVALPRPGWEAWPLPTADVEEALRENQGNRKIGVFGHSFGGAASVQMLADKPDLVAAAVDLDGYLYGPVVRDGVGTRKPVLVMGFPEHFATDDPDAAAPGWPALRGWRRDFTVAGTVHESFSDVPVLADLLGEEPVGAVGGARMVQIMEMYVDAFFRKFLLGADDESLLSGNSSTFPEVSLRRG